MKCCSVENCGSVNFCKGYCRKHFERWKRHGDPLVILKPLSPRGAPMSWIKDNIGYDGDDCLIWPFARFPDGRAHMNGKKPARVMCELTHGPAPTRQHEAAHGCGNGHLACVNPRHLRWATSKENAADKTIHGTLLTGHQLPQAKLTERDVQHIRAARGALKGKDLAIQFGVAASCISKIQNNKAWRHLLP